MSKKKNDQPFKNWEDVNTALRRIAEIDVLCNDFEGDMTLKINEIKSKFAAKVKDLKDEKIKLESNITDFAENCKDEFIKTRKKELDFGTIAYRVTKRVTIRSIQATLTALKSLGLHNCIRIKEEPNKDELAELDTNTLAKVGASLKVEDKLRIEPNIERIKGAVTRTGL
jgi:phage host-nuclease inhibitor protein Gam